MGATAIQPLSVDLIDTHCHLDAHAFAHDLDAVLNRAATAGVTRVIVPALDMENVHTVLGLTEEYEDVYAAVGVHPNSAMNWRDEWIDDLRTLAMQPQVVAIGEIGLDYYWDRTPIETQHHALSRQLALAAELALPVILHNRDSSTDLLALLAESPLPGTGRLGVFHSFSGDWATAEAALNMGFYLGFTGPLTYKNADELRAIASRTPLDRILVETDAPFLSPHPHRGQRNEPAHVRLVAERLAELRGLSLPDLAAITTANAERLFNLRSA
jgi:TatD DNase family protein